ncbi:glycosyltransferase [Mangrovivirga sp. M17]|uniref:Glycosyltransferase n=1 Tax=Mangrovivirga halotolerans TaxID=2993936 RepID=A0ABT3RW91_9BACT|nr:glycosyltransferase [Mangrovivirga halotolerans]MCX2745791.1 glycosyltransferase [Mangrovivirga halotolerans]
MKLVHISTEKFWRGGEQQIAYLINHLNDRGVENYLICDANSEMEKYAIDNNLNYFSINYVNSINPIAILKLSKLIKQINPDYVHLHSSKAHTLGLLAGKLINFDQFILHRRVIFPIKQKQINIWKYNTPRLLKIICISKAVEEEVEKIVKDPEKITVIHSAIDLNRFKNISNEKKLHEEFDFEEDNKLVVNVSALNREKNLETFIKAASLVLRKSDVNIKFLIVGEGPEKDNLMELTRTLNIEDHVIFTGFRKDVPNILLQSDLFVLTSISEGLGSSILDAFASGVPAVASKVGGIPEIVIDNYTGYTLEPGDEEGFAFNILKLIENNTLRKELSENALQLVSDYSIKSMIDKYLQLYKELEGKG